MAGSIKHLAVIAALSFSAAACASAPPADYSSYADYGTSSGAQVQNPGQRLECVPYARARAHMAVYGDAWTWWDQTQGRYVHSSAPQTGAVMVLDGYAGPHRAHLAVVRTVISGREIRVDHANWLDEGNIHLDDPVYDVSADNDWSQVRVFNLSTHAWGGRIYPVRGFIGPGPDTGPAPALVASDE
jgi:hypothetical protein